jgi:hypothetical protein
MSVDVRSRRRPTSGDSDPASTYTRVLSILLIPFLMVAFVILYVLPFETDTLFAWTIEPPLTSMLLASAYLGGVWFFVASARRRGWSLIGRGMPAVLIFATLLLIATVMHIDRFHAGHVSFITWLALYITTPLLVTVAIVVQRRAVTGTNGGAREYRIPLPVRLVLAAIGLAAMVFGIALFFNLNLLMSSWPWKLTPLTAQVVGAVLTLPGVVNVALLIDGRWSAFRTIFQAQVLSLVAIAGALAIRNDDLGRTGASVAFVVGIALSLVAYVVFFLYCERQMRGSTFSMQ